MESQSGEKGGHMLSVMWSLTFSRGQNWALLLMLHVAESCCQRWYLPVTTLSIQIRILSFKHMMASVKSLRLCVKMYGVITLPSLATTSNTVMWTGYVGFITIGISGENWTNQRLFCEFTCLHLGFCCEYQIVQHIASKFLVE